MCLDDVTKTFDSPSPKIRVGYKVFDNRLRYICVNDKLYFAFRRWKGTREVPVDRWIEAQGIRIRYAPEKFYPAGFHIYKEHGNWYGRRMVFFRGLLVSGVQSGDKVWVAKELYVPWKTTHPPDYKGRRRGSLASERKV